MTKPGLTLIVPRRVTVYDRISWVTHRLIRVRFPVKRFPNNVHGKILSRQRGTKVCVHWG